MLQQVILHGHDLRDIFQACVSLQVLGGADLFLQGLIVPDGGLGHFSAGDLRAVSIPGNAFPFAVGTMEVSSEQVAKTGLRGKGLKLLHFFGDQLWGLGDKSSPDPSFTAARIFPTKVHPAVHALLHACESPLVFCSRRYAETRC